MLQRALTDFGADESFAEATKKVRTHYGVDVAVSTTRLTVEKHARAMEKKEEKYLNKNPQPAANTIIGQTDGSMIPVIEQKDSFAKESTDKRKNNDHKWKEVRLALARAQGSVSSVYAASTGSTDEAGKQLSLVVKHAGESETTKIHCLGDGALWIAEQTEKQFGTKAKYLLDYYHASQYLAEAASCLQPESSKQFLHQQQNRLKQNQTQAVLNDLQQDCKGRCESKEKCLALKCYNYLIKRLNQLDYKSAIEAGLPIGSGEIESSHRSIIQKRLKIPGAWWRIQNAMSMLSLRIIRANGFWEDYWNEAQSLGEEALSLS